MRSQAASIRRNACSALANGAAARHAKAAALLDLCATSSTSVAARTPRKPTRVSHGRPLSSIVGGGSSGSKHTTTADASAEENIESSPEPPQEGPTPPSEPTGEATTEETEKPRRKRATKEPAAPTLPPDLNVLWSPAKDGSAANEDALPPTQIFSEALTSMLVALHPQTQNRAAYATAGGPPVEPSMALYCPIEGGDYVVDETVKELARRTGADVLVIDAVQLAAGEWGVFGKASSVLQLPQNPLHFPSSSPVSQSRAVREEEEEEEDEEDSPTPAGAFLQFVTPSPSRPNRSFVSTTRTASPASKTKAFFDELLNLPSSHELLPRTPRIVYIRDCPTLAASSSAWYPHLLAALRSRRQGAMVRSTAPVVNPTALVLGITPPLAGGPSTIESGGEGSNPLNLMYSAREGRGGGGGSSSAPTSRNPRVSKGGAWGEDDFSEAARASRLRTRLSKWERGGAGALADELPLLEASGDGDGSGEGGRPNGVVVVNGGQNVPTSVRNTFSSFLSGAFGGGGGLSSLSGRGASDGESGGKFFRTTVLVPNERSKSMEQTYRVARRREINELTMRMGVGAVGGVLGEMEAAFVQQTKVAASEQASEDAAVTTPEAVAAEPAISDDKSEVVASFANSDTSASADTAPSNALKTDALSEPTPEPSAAERMWEDWGKRLEGWTTVRQIADRALGNALAASVAPSQSLDSTKVAWQSVHDAWAAQRASREVRRAWLQSTSKGAFKDKDMDEKEDLDELADIETDEIVDRVKRDPDLDQHEQRLLSCIVDSATMPTSFNQVHLPAHTIDSVRTVVSLPLLFPDAFQTGILREHGMTGVLLFGPPGTGKTLLARALAKEAGCRMMSIAPSDVMDMYVGEGEKLVRSAFALARRLAPCVLFVDELDALFGARSSGRESGGALAHRGVLTEFMQEMDGLRSRGGDNVIVIGATNRPFDLDDAVLRRLPRRLLVDLPGENERESILKILLRDETLGPDVSLRHIAKQTESFSGSDLKHLAVSAALDAVKEQITVPWAVIKTPTASTEGTGSSATTTSVESSEAQSPVSEDASTYTATPVSEQASTTVAAFTENSTTASSSDLPVSSSDVTSSSTSVPVSETASSSSPDTSASETSSTSEISPRTLRAHNFTKALKEITASASESLGTLADLRKWNDEFGEGRKDKKRVQVWGRGNFGFSIKPPGESVEGGVRSDVNVAASTTSTSKSAGSAPVSTFSPTDVD